MLFDHPLAQLQTTLIGNSVAIADFNLFRENLALYLHLQHAADQRFLQLQTISRISKSFHSLQSINISYTLPQEEYNTQQTQAIRTLAYQLDLTLEIVLTTHKKVTPAMTELLND